MKIPLAVKDVICLSCFPTAPSQILKKVKYNEQIMTHNLAWATPNDFQKAFENKLACI